MDAFEEINQDLLTTENLFSPTGILSGNLSTSRGTTLKFDHDCPNNSFSSGRLGWP